MTKRIISQNRGKGTPTYRAPSHQYLADIKHLKFDDDITLKGTIIKLRHDPGRTAPVGLVRFEGRDDIYLLMPEGISIGEEIQCGAKAEIKPGNTLPLQNIPEGVSIFNVEFKPFDGGKSARASGVYAILVAHENKRTMVQLPSGKMKWVSSKCRATIGVVSGGGRIEKPLLKAGKKYNMMKSKAGKYPRVSGVAMNSIDHPFGGGGHQHPGKPKTVSRGAPPGRKVGSIAARRTGKR